MNTEQFEGEVYPYDVDEDGIWTLPDGSEINITDIQFETPRGEAVWVVAVTKESELFPACVFCKGHDTRNVVLLLDNGEYIYMSRCCGQVAFCEGDGEDNGRRLGTE